MTAYAIVQGGVVVDTVEWDGVPYTAATEGAPARGWTPPAGSTAVSIHQGSAAGIGWIYDGTEFTQGASSS
jgi:hypothetical protein